MSPRMQILASSVSLNILSNCLDDEWMKKAFFNGMVCFYGGYCFKM